MRLFNLLKSSADAIAASILAAMFFVFLLQIISRYIFNNPLSWSVELTLSLWVWLVFWGSSFCLDDKDHIKFDVLYYLSPIKVRKLFRIISAIIVIFLISKSLIPTLEYINFYKIKKSAILKIRYDYLFSVYAIFTVSIISSYAFLLIKTIKNKE